MDYSALVPPQKPFAFEHDPESILKAAEDLIGERGNVWDSVVAAHASNPESATVDTVIWPIVHNQNHYINDKRALEFYESTSPIKEVRDASQKASNLFSHAATDLYLRDDMFRLVDAVKKKLDQEVESAAPEIRRFVEKVHHEFLINGCALPDGPAKDALRNDVNQLVELQHQFRRNLNEDKTGLWFTAEELDGVPDDVMSRLKPGSEENSGKFWASMKPNIRGQILKYAKPESTRRTYFTFLQNRFNEENVPLHRQIVLLRDKIARQLGFVNHAALKTQERMISTPEAINDFLGQILPPLKKQGFAQVEKLREIKKQDINAKEGDEVKLFYWDRAYYERVEDEQASSIDFKQIQQYFELFLTQRHLIAIYEHIFDIHFEPVTPEAAQRVLGEKAKHLTVHDDVKLFSVWNATEKPTFIGYMYFDFFPRDGKYTHVGHYTLQSGYAQPDGSRHYPSAAIVANYMPPTDDKPSLLTLDQVRSLFHEMGHGLHNLLSLTQCARFHGTAVERDFVEAPSVMFEYFFWTLRHIKEVSSHHKTGEQLPDETINTILSLRLSSKPLALLQNLHFATYDMTVHNPPSREALENMNLAETFNRTRNATMMLEGGEAFGEGWEWGHYESVFRHINAGGYDVGYYAYVMGRIWAIDIFESTFKADTMSKTAGRKYRDMVLQVGGSQPAMKTLTEFLGRMPSPEAYYQWSGISEVSKL